MLLWISDNLLSATRTASATKRLPANVQDWSPKDLQHWLIASAGPPISRAARRVYGEVLARERVSGRTLPHVKLAGELWPF